MATITIEIPEDLAEQLQAAGLLTPEAFLTAVTNQLAQQSHADQRLSEEEIEAILDELHGLCADENWTMEDILAMKREERELEERKMNLH